MAAADSLGNKGFTPPAIGGREMAYPLPIDRSVLVVHIRQAGLRLGEACVRADVLSRWCWSHFPGASCQLMSSIPVSSEPDETQWPLTWGLIRSPATDNQNQLRQETGTLCSWEARG